MAEKAKQKDSVAREVTILVGELPDKALQVRVDYQDDEPYTWSFDSWDEATAAACATARDADIYTLGIRFKIAPDEERQIEAYVPDVKERWGLGPAMVQVERQLERRGFDTKYVSGGIWVIHRPDSADGYSTKRGYYNAAQTIRLATTDPELVDEELKNYFRAHEQQSEYAPYLRMRKARYMAKNDSEKPAKEVRTVKGLDGKDYQVSPKQEEVYNTIKARSASGSPLGSDEERLSDPDSIAAMNLARQGIVLREKFGTRWHYFAKQADLDKAVKAAEQAAAAAQKEKDAKRQEREAARAAKSEGKADAAAAGAAAGGKKKGGPLKKPSEK